MIKNRKLILSNWSHCMRDLKKKIEKRPDYKNATSPKSFSGFVYAYDLSPKFCNFSNRVWPVLWTFLDPLLMNFVYRQILTITFYIKSEYWTV